MSSWVVEYWQFAIGTALAVIGIVIAVATILYQRQPKQLDWQLRSDIQLLRPQAKGFRERFAFSYDEIPMDDPRIVVVRIKNTGKKAIAEHDFNGGEPITITYEYHPPMDVQVIATSSDIPSNDIGKVTQKLGTDGVSDDFGVVEIMPRLLNPGEWFNVQLLSDHDHGEIKIDARFAEQRHPMRRVDPSSRFGTRRMIIGALTGAFLGIVIGLALVQLPQPTRITMNNILDLALEGLGVAFLITMLVLIIRKIRRHSLG